MLRNKDFLSGVMFCLFGAGALLVASNYRLGSALRMGPAYFPIIIGGLILLSGVVISVRAWMEAETDRQVGPLRIKPLVFILASVALFALSLGSLGLVTSLAILIVASRLAALRGRVAELPVMVAVLIAIGLAVFVGALDISLPLWPR